MKTRIQVALLLALLPAAAVQADGVTRYPLPNGNKFPIAQAVEVPAGMSLIFHSGTTPSPMDPKAAQGSVEYWGDTKTQAMRVLNAMKASLQDSWRPTRNSLARPINQTFRRVPLCRSQDWRRRG